MTSYYGAIQYLPIVPPGYCEICHQAADILTMVEIIPSGRASFTKADGSKGSPRAARAVRACGRHAGGNGTPVVTPNTTTLQGTTALRPQELRLFDEIPYRIAGEAARRWTR